MENTARNEAIMLQFICEIQVNICNWAPNKRWHRDERLKSWWNRAEMCGFKTGMVADSRALESK